MDEQYLNEGQQRLLRLINLLAGHELVGLAPMAIAAAQGCSASLVTRDLANLALAGMAEKVPDTGYWRLSPHIVQISLRHAQALTVAQQRLHELQSRFSRS